MPDNRNDIWSGQIQTLFLDQIKADPLPETPLIGLANTNLIPTHKGSNTFRIFTRPFVAMDRESLADFRARGSNTNPLVSNVTDGGQIVSKAFPNKFEELNIDIVATIAFDIERTAGIDSLFNQPEQVAKRARQTYQDAWVQAQHNEAAMQAINSDEFVVATTATVSAFKDGDSASGIDAGDTTFEISNAEKASSGILAGDLVKIGAERKADAVDGQVETVDVALVQIVGADDSGEAGFATITIETDPTRFPPASNFFASFIFAKLVIVLAAHAVGVRTQIDRPTAVTALSIDNLIGRVRFTAMKKNIDPSKLVIYTTPEVQELMIGTTTGGARSPFIANDFLGKGILRDGLIQGTYRGIKVVADANAIRRTGGGGVGGVGVTLASERHYMWAFEMGQGFAYESVLDSIAFDKLPGRAGLIDKFSAAHIHGSMMPRGGAIRSLLVPLTV